MGDTDTISQIKNILNDPKFLCVNKAIFWRDLLLFAAAGWSFLYLSVAHHSLYVIPATYFFYRGTMLIHEVIHLSKKIPGYRFVYNLLLGWPNSYPAYIYDTHLFHHGKKTYGTKKDPEYKYIEFNALSLIRPLLIAPLMPLLQVIRFGVIPFITPFMPASFQQKLFSKYSTLVFDVSYERNFRGKYDLKTMMINDLISAFYKVVAVALIVTGYFPVTLLLMLYTIVTLASLLNMYRALFNHYYANEEELPLSWSQHMHDTVTVDSFILKHLLFINGLNYHALHHLYPEMPYHNLAMAHQKLMRELPEGHLYKEGVHFNVTTLLKKILNQNRTQRIQYSSMVATSSQRSN